MHQKSLCLMGVLAFSTVLACIAGCAHAGKAPSAAREAGGEAAMAAAPPPEFRGMVVTTAFNMDWPSQPSLYWEVADSEIEAIVSRAEELNFNAIILQVRAFGDRIRRDSNIAAREPTAEPWSPALGPTGDSNPDPFPDSNYDPYTAWIQRCHARGLQF